MSDTDDLVDPWEHLRASGGEDAPRRPRRTIRLDIAAAILIPVLVAGIPFLSNRRAGGTGEAVTVVTRATPPATTTPATAPADPGATPISALPAGPDPAGSAWAAGPDPFWELFRAANRTTTPAVPAPPPARPAPPATTGPPTTSPPATTPPATSPPATAPPTHPTLPQAPRGLVLEFGGTDLKAGWEPVSDNTDGSPFSDFGGYEVTLAAAGVTRSYPVAVPRFTLSLEQNRAAFGTPAAEFTVAVRVLNAAGNRSEPATGVAANGVPLTPTGAPQLAAGATTITITAPAPAGAADFAGFEIWHSTSPGGPFELLGSTDGVASYTHDVSPGTTHHYVYKLRDAFGQVSPGFSPTATATAL